MRNRKLYPLLALLSQDDQESFSLFMDSPYFNTSHTLKLFWEQWRLCILESERGEELSVEDFVKGTPIKASRFDRLCSQLYPKFRQFLILKKLEKESEFHEVMYSGAILDRDHDQQISPRIIKQTEKILQNYPESPEKYLGSFFHELWVTRDMVRTRQAAPDFQDRFSKMLELIERFAGSKSLQLSCAAVNIGQIIRQKGNSMEEMVLSKVDLKSDWVSQGFLSQIYTLVLSLQLGYDTNDVFADLIQKLEEHQNKISEEVLNEIYNFVLNHCIRQVNLGNTAFLDHTLDLHIHLLKSNLLLENGKLLPQHYKNIVALGCRAGRLDWTGVFIEEYANLLADDFAGFAKRYNQAILRFHQQRYAESIVILKDLIQVPNLDVFYGLDARGYLWKAYYENRSQLNSEEVDDMYRLYDSIRLYVDRNTKISELHKQQYRNFVRLFKRFLFLLQILDEKKRAVELIDFREELVDIGDIPNKTWFSQKLEEAIEGLPHP